jgi:hypothetical protein
MNALSTTSPADPTAKATLLLVAITAVIAVIGIWQAFLTRRALQAATQDTRELAGLALISGGLWWHLLPKLWPPPQGTACRKGFAGGQSCAIAMLT